MPAAAGQPSAAQQYAAAYSQNQTIRNLIVHGAPGSQIPPAVDMWQQLNPVVPAVVAPGTVLTALMRNVGLIKRLVVKITATVTAGATSAQTLTKLGLSNLISNILFTDLANNQRINTSGWHAIAVSSAKRRRVWGAAITTDTPFGYGSNYAVCKTGATIAANGTSALTLFLEIPFVRNDHDLRGAIFGDVTSANAQLQITMNPNMFVASGTDATLAVYQSAGADLATLSAFKWQVYQNYLDQLPRQSNGAPILPPLDIGTAYILTQTASAGAPVANQDNTFAFINQRQFLSATTIYDNNGTLNAGTDIDHWSIVSANYTNIRYVDPLMQALMARTVMSDDLPAGMYYFDFSDRPIDTVQYGNMQLILNPLTVGGAGAVVLLGWEAYGTIGLVNQGGSIPSGS